jgi:hypothetical protein
MSRNIGGEWTLTQSDGAVVTMDIAQNGSSFTGFARFRDTVGNIAQGDGFVTDTDFFCVIHWGNGPVGEYNGKFGLNGRLTGHTFDQTNPSSQAGFQADRLFN